MSLGHGHQKQGIAAHAQAGELVAQFKATVLLMPNGSDRVTSAPLQKLETDKKVCSRNSLQSCISPFVECLACWNSLMHSFVELGCPDLLQELAS